MPLDNKCRIAGLSAHKSGFIEDDTSPVCQPCPRSAKIQSTLCRTSAIKPTSVSRLLMVSLDGTGKEIMALIDASDVVGAEWPLNLAIFCVPGKRYTLP
ncbi:hypothetical protein TNCV_919371 [Trichonephila clavipes]|nr:hypothetical protein TNCV_919371 [Trichonephila clavipes]